MNVYVVLPALHPLLSYRGCFSKTKPLTHIGLMNSFIRDMFQELYLRALESLRAELEIICASSSGPICLAWLGRERV